MAVAVERRGVARAALQYSGSLRLGATILGAMIALSVLGHFVLPAPTDQDLTGALSAPGENGYLLGSDSLGRDVLAWTAAGILTACIVSVSVVIIAAVIGVVVGLIAGYYGGFLDSLLMRVVDLQLAIPPLLFFIAASVVVGHSLPALVGLLAIFSWVPYARVVRTKVLVERERDHVSAARLAGASRRRILLTHLLPSSAGLIFTFASIQAGLVLLWEAGLSFLGVGLQPPDISLGFLILQGRAEMATAWWVVAFPGAAIVLLVVAFNLIGNGLRDLFHADVRLYDR